MELSLNTLFLIALIMVISPLIAELPLGFRMPMVVVELVSGIIVGPHVLDLVQVDAVLAFLGTFGLTFLFFIAGMEIDFSLLRGRPLTLGIIGWLLSLALAQLISVGLMLVGFVEAPILVGIALTTTAIGTLLPILRDAKELDTRFGHFLLGAGSMGEFGPILALSLLAPFIKGDAHGAEWREPVLLFAFSAIAMVTAWIGLRARPFRIALYLRRHLTTSSQLPVRVAVCLLITLVALAGSFGLDVILGAFAAGMVIGTIMRAIDDGERLNIGHKIFEQKLEALSFGFFIPLFFVVSGIHFNLAALLDLHTLARVPIFLLLFLIVRGLPVVALYREELEAPERLRLALFSATGLPLVVAITEIGVLTGRMRTDNAAALVGGALISVLVFPLFALALDSSRKTG